MKRQGSTLLMILTGLFVATPGLAKDGKKTNERKPSQIEERGSLFVSPPEKVFTTAEKKALCAKYRNQALSYYNSLYRINNACQKIKLSKEDLAQDVVRPKPIEVSGPVLRVFPLLTVKSARTRVPSCTELNGKYVTASDTSHVVYFVQNCQRRLFPDTATFEEHRGKLTEQTKIVSIPEPALRKIKRGRNFVSVLERVYEDLLPSTAPIEIIPIDEACSGIVNTYVSYLGEIFFIEKQPGKPKHCKRRVVNGFQFTRRMAEREESAKKIYELTATQAQSIPEGKPLAGF